MKSAEVVSRVVRSVLQHGHKCPCHSAMPGTLSYALHHPTQQFQSTRSVPIEGFEQNRNRVLQWKSSVLARPKTVVMNPRNAFATTIREAAGDYAFEMATSNIRFGFGATREVGYDLVDLKAKHVCVFVDPNLKALHDNTKDNSKGYSPLTTVLESLDKCNVKYSVFSDIKVEPTDTSFKQAIQFASTASPPFDAFVAVGGGSTMDTAKAANLYSSYPPEDFLDYVNGPIGKGLPPPGPVKPLIAIPTTAGTGSEATGVAIFDYEAMHAKTGIANRKLKPLLGIVDPNNTRFMPKQVAIASGFDVLCHSLESYTAIPYTERTPAPSKPIERPAYQGSNPISDVWALHSLGLVTKNLPLAVEDPSNDEARAQTMLSAALAGVGFGNAGVHLCHGMSYPVSGMVRSFIPEGYNTKKPIIPHGLSVVLHAPAVFRFTAVSSPERHLAAAAVMGADVSNAKPEDAGPILVDQIIKIMHRLNVPNGLTAVGFTRDDIPDLVKGTLPQHRVTKLAPRPTGQDELAKLFEDSMVVYK